MYVASKHASAWKSDSTVKANFRELKYETHRDEPPKNPTNREELLSADKTHYCQAGYNGWGIFIGENMYNYLRTDNIPQKVFFEDINMKRLTSVTLGLDESMPIVILASNTTGSNFDIRVSDNLEYGECGIIKGLALGEGTLTVYVGEKLIATLKVTVK